MPIQTDRSEISAENGPLSGRQKKTKKKGEPEDQMASMSRLRTNHTTEKQEETATQHKEKETKLFIWTRIKQQREKREMQSRLQSKLLTQERKECFSFEFQIAAIRGFSSSRLR